MSGKKVGKYEIGRTLGEGTFGKVKAATDRETGEAFAIKILDKDRIVKQNMGSQIKREISIMKLFSHPNIVQLKEVLASKTKLYLVLEIVTGGELFDEIVSESRFSEAKARFYIKQLLDGVEYCHNKGVCHRDLKPENLLLDGEKRLKISDFGLSTLYTSSSSSESLSSRKNLLHTTCGTPSYVAPEVLEDEGYDGKSADIWSIGVILYVLCAGYLPFDEKTLPVLFEKIQTANYSVPLHFSQSLRNLLSTILVTDPKSRSSIEQIRNHPWILETPNNELKSDDSHYPDKISLSPNIYNSHAPSKTSHDEKTSRCSSFHFQSTFSSSHETYSSMLNHLREMEFTVKTVSAKGWSKIKASRRTSKGIIGMVICISQDGNVEIKRGKGDIMEYHNFFIELTVKRLGWSQIET